MHRIRFLAVFAMLAVAVPAVAQTPAIGFKLGPTFSTWAVGDGDDHDTSTMTAFGGGGFVRFGQRSIGLQIDVLVVTKGAEAVGFTDGDAEIKLDYIEVPVQLVLSYGISKARPYFMFGPSVGFEIGCGLSVDVDDADDPEADCDDANFFERDSPDFGIAGAAGVTIPVGPGDILFEARYTHGMTNIYEESGIDDNEVKNRSWAIFGGYSIPLGF
jgi:hypothetical protein